MLLGDYHDSASEALACQDIYREALYAQAEELEAAGDLQGAYERFKSLEGYNDAGARASDLAQRLGLE